MSQLATVKKERNIARREASAGRKAQAALHAYDEVADTLSAFAGATVAGAFDRKVGPLRASGWAGLAGLVLVPVAAKHEMGGLEKLGHAMVGAGCGAAYARGAEARAMLNLGNNG